jgi:peptidase M28-like protein
MEPSSGTALARLVLVAFVALGLWALARYETFRPPVLPASASPTLFSAARAEAVLARILGPEHPHPVSSDENGAVRERILREYAALGVPAKTFRSLGCRLNKKYGELACATVTDVLAQVRPGNGKAIVMLSHYDSVPAGPGASDDESGTASVIESARALKAESDAGVHPILAVNTDGEEFGLLGAAAFLDNRQLKSLVGAVVNVEARGDQGPSLLFQTSPGDGPLIDLYARSVRAYATSSLFAVIYKLLPNDTDLTLFIHDGFLSWNFAFSDRVAHYHTPLDRRENLDPQTLQMQGENLLGVARGLSHTDFGALKGGDDIYISILGRWLPRLPATWALPLSLIAFVALSVLAFVGRREPAPIRRWLTGFAIFPLVIVLAAAAGWTLHTIACLVSGEPDPSYAYPSSLRLALALGVFAAALLVARMGDVRTTALASWIWMAFLAVVSSALLPGLSPFFLFPILVAVPVLAALVLWSKEWQRLPIQIVLLIGALPSLLIWLSLVAAGETINGLALHQIFTVPSAIALATVAPLLTSRGLTQRVWGVACAGLFSASLGLAVVAGLQPAYSAIKPQRLSINYVEDAASRRSFWMADANAPLPQSLRAAADFSKSPVRPYAFAFQNAYVAPAGERRFTPPTATVSSGRASAGMRHVSLAIHGSPSADQIILAVPKNAELKMIEIGGKHFEVPKEWSASPLPFNFIACFSRDCAGETIGFDLTSAGSINVLISEIRYGLPPGGAKLTGARPKSAIASQNGDTTVLINDFNLPGT